MQIVQTERAHGIDTSIDDVLKELNFGLVEVVYEWARGMVCTVYIIIITHKITCDFGYCTVN